MKKYLIVYLIISLTCNQLFSQRLLFPSNLLPNSTIRIFGFNDTLINGTLKRFSIIGTGFFYEFDFDSIKFMAIVTNRHVVEKSKEGILTFKIQDSSYKLGDRIKSDTIKISKFKEKWIFHPTEDIAILPLDDIRNYFVKKYKREMSFTWFNKSLVPSLKDSIKISSIEKVLMIGYPKNLWDSTNNLPAVRQGLTATPFFSDFNGQKRFLIDIPTFPGSSGSPVVLYSFDPYWIDTTSVMDEFRSYLLGIAVESYTYNEDGKILSNNPAPFVPDSIEKKYKSQINLPLNIAIVIKADRLFDFYPLIKAYINRRKSGLFP